MQKKNEINYSQNMNKFIFKIIYNLVMIKKKKKLTKLKKQINKLKCV